MNNRDHNMKQMIRILIFALVASYKLDSEYQNILPRCTLLSLSLCVFKKSHWISYWRCLIVIRPSVSHRRLTIIRATHLSLHFRSLCVGFFFFFVPCVCNIETINLGPDTPIKRCLSAEKKTQCSVCAWKHALPAFVPHNRCTHLPLICLTKITKQRQH